MSLIVKRSLVPLVPFILATLLCTLFPRPAPPPINYGARCVQAYALREPALAGLTLETYTNAALSPYCTAYVLQLDKVY